MAAEAQFQMVPTSALDESPLNPRRAFDKEKLAELVESVRSKGVLEPLVVRPKGKGFEVAAGARRLRAAKEAGLKQVPAMVRELTDDELLEVALLENVVRVDISPLEEGEAYKALLGRGYTVEQLQAKTGKSRTVIFQRQKLASLQGGARKALEAGLVSASVAELLARLPTADAQERALQRLKKEASYHFVGEDGEWGQGRANDNISRLPFRDARGILDEEFRLVLAKASFDVKDAQLVAGVGACGSCPKRTGADKAIFPDIKQDTCLDSACWARKVGASTRALKEVAKVNGKTLVKIGRLKDQYSDRLAAPVAAKYARPSDKPDGKHTWKELCGGEPAMVVALDRDNKTHNLVDKAATLEWLAAKDAKKAEALKKALEKPAEDDWKARQAADAKKRAEEQLVSSYVVSRALTLVTMDDALKLVLLALAEDRWRWGNLCRRVGLDEKTKPEALKQADVPGVLTAWAVGEASYSAREAVQAHLAKLAKLDVKALRKKAAAAEKGTCFVCGCTEAKACAGGCEWTDDEAQTLCSACAGEGE